MQFFRNDSRAHHSLIVNLPHLQPGTCTLDDLSFVVDDHVIQASYDSTDCTPPRMTIPGVNIPFEALQFHIHTGSDHAIDSTYYGADMHLVHKEVGGTRLAVLGLFLEPTNPSDDDKFSSLLVEWESVEAATLEMIDALRSETPAGKLPTGRG